MNKTSETQQDTKERILDAAEYLFAREGYRGTSLRSITSRAKVNLAAVNYHFGTKKNLVEDVIKRRILPLNAIRNEKIDQVISAAEGKGKRPDIKAVMAAFIEPTLLFRESGPGAEHFFTFIGRSFTDPDNTVRQVFLKYIMPLFNKLLETASDALPNHPQDILFWRLHFTLGALFHTLHVCSNVKNEFQGMTDKMDGNKIINLILPYVTAGMKAK